MRLSFVLNGRPVEVDVAPERVLLEILREQLGVTSCKEGCGEGECGACAVFLNGRLVNACLISAVAVEGTDVVTLEGLLEETAVLRESFVAHDAAQCGFCTPGFVMAAYDYLRGGGDPSPSAIRAALDGNLCRCTGYQNIIEAISDAAEEKR
jgi:aerobic-type carbon monoxide dehydrogenase small subunit (CoxS/CutS family)